MMIIQLIKGFFFKGKYIFYKNLSSTLLGIGLNEKSFDLAKILVLRLFKMVVIQTECSRLELRFVIKFLVTQKCKPRDIF